MTSIDRPYRVEYRGGTPSLGGGWTEDLEGFATEEEAVEHARQLLRVEGRVFARVVNVTRKVNLSPRR
jgi:hypothetical protein